MAVSVAAIVVAGGSGSRMGGKVSKQYLLLGGLPLLGHSLKVLDVSPEVEAIVLVIPEGDMAWVRRDILPSLAIQTPMFLASGGNSRQASVASGLAAVDPDTEYVLVHDAARPFLEMRHIRETLAAARTHGAATLAVAAVDTLRRKLSDGKTAPLDRRDVMVIQTPQAFRTALLRQAHALAAGEGETDDAGLVAAMGHEMVFVPGSSTNLKVTRSEDLLLAEAIWHLGKKDFSGAADA